MPDLSIILPAHNEERRLPTALARLDAYAYTSKRSIEVIVVENGSADHTLAVARHWASDPFDTCSLSYLLRVIHEDLPGKGRAVRRGMLEAEGRYRVFCDVDFSMPPALINTLINHCVDVSIASREAPEAVLINMPPIRRLTGRLFNLAAQVLLLPGIRDTQCGFKCFTARAAEDIFRYVHTTGWAFDVEALYIARCLGYHIAEVGIPWTYNAESKVRPFRDGLTMLAELIRLTQLKRQHFLIPWTEAE